MKISDLLGHTIDLFGGDATAKEDPAAYTTMDTSNPAKLTPAQADLEDHTESELFIAPLQQKIELLKRAVGVDNFYDKQHGEEDELEQILKIAGVPTATIFDAGDDEPLDS